MPIYNIFGFFGLNRRLVLNAVQLPFRAAHHHFTKREACHFSPQHNRYHLIQHQGR